MKKSRKLARRKLRIARMEAAAIVAETGLTYQVRVHELKCWPEYFGRIHCQKKTAEIRRADRDYRVGDILVLREWCPRLKRYTGAGQIVRQISDIVGHSDAPAIAKGYVLLSLIRVPSPLIDAVVGIGARGKVSISVDLVLPKAA